MFLKKALASGVASSGGFFLNKKLTAFFIFTSLFINGFALSAAEAGRYNFVMVAATAAQNAVMQIFKKCDVSLTDISGGFCKDIFGFLNMPFKNEKNKSGQSQHIPDSGIPYLGINKTGEKNKIFKSAALFPSLGAIIKPHETSAYYTVIHNLLFSYAIIMFLMFIFSIVRRKETDDNIIKNINILKTEISV